jgi:tetratricopeptide (TPR) repeat protein
VSDVVEGMLRTKAVVVTIALFVVLLTSWAYAPSLDVLFVFDDRQNIVDSPAVHWTEFSRESLRSLLDASRLQSRPVANLSFALDHLRGGLEPRVFHLTNILIHFGVALALFWLTLLYVRLAQPIPDRATSYPRTATFALLAIGIFLVHPLNTQAVTYIVQRMSSLAALFTLLAFASYLMARYRLTARHRWWYFSALICWLLAIGSKEIGVLLLPVIGAYELCFFRNEWRSKVEQVIGGTWNRKWTNWYWGTCAAVGLLVVAIVMESRAGIGLTEDWPWRDFNGVERLMTQARVMVFHLSQVVWPVPGRLSLEHDFAVSRSLLQPVTTLPAVIACIVMLLASVYLAVQRPRYGFPLLAYALFHAIEAGPVSLELIFEHRMYLPSTMLALGGATLLVDSWPRWQPIAVAAIVVIMLGFAFWTHERNRLWSDPVEFHRDMAIKAPSNTRVHYNLALMLKDTGEPEQALSAIQRAIALDSSDGDLWRLFGSILLDLGHAEEAVSAYRDALRLEPRKIRSILGLGEALRASGRDDEAFDHYLSAGINLARIGAPWEAIPVLQRAVESRQEDADARNALGSAYMTAGLVEKALQEFQRAVELDPSVIEAWYNMGLAADRLNRTAEALNAYEGFVQRAPVQLQQPIAWARSRIEALSQ